MDNEFVSGSSVSSTSEEDESHKSGSSFSNYTYTQVFEEQFPYYMLYGMTYDEYWNQDSLLAKYYRKAYELKRKARNEELWLQGMYIYEVMTNLYPLYSANAKSGTKVEPYREEPYPITRKDLKEYQEKQNRKEVEKKKADFEALVTSFNSTFKRKEEDVDGG